jgi:hypothetical protein
MSYFAEIDPDTKIVIRTVVADSAEWCEQHLGGMWLETADPYAEQTQLNYCGPGFGADPAVPERFALPWDVTLATVPDAQGNYRYRTLGEVVFHNGKIWRNLMPTNNPNVWEPPTNWREYPMGTEHPLWVQPVGSVDAYPLDFIVEHNGKVWKSLHAANVWAPTAGLLWEDLSPAPEIEEWTQPTGGHDAYNIGDQVTFNGQTWESVINGNVWSPAAHPAGWKLI